MISAELERTYPLKNGKVHIVFIGNAPWLYSESHSDENLSDNNFQEQYKIIFDRFPIKKLLYLDQVHDNQVISAEQTIQPITLMGKADALITTEKLTALLIRTADCIPILGFHETTETIMAVHAGWRGLHKKIVSNALLSAHFANGKNQNQSLETAQWKFHVGPFIATEHYEVQSDMLDHFSAEKFLRHDSKIYLDLKSILMAEFSALHINSSHIDWSDIDTYKNPHWFSARNGHTKRNFALIWRS